ncbi:unnamed protein product [Linum trigynum]|uniref:Uncharacterized protein n=1 Tax=Linum trigynum TaxID=586398 RepID=A0AAV2GLX8_9ROSI
MASNRTLAAIIIVVLMVAAAMTESSAASEGGSVGCRIPCEEDCNKKHDYKNREYCQMTCATTCYNKPIIDFMMKLFASNPKS